MKETALAESEWIRATNYGTCDRTAANKLLENSGKRFYSWGTVAFGPKTL